jgi:hypothetical protein
VHTTRGFYVVGGHGRPDIDGCYAQSYVD